VKGYLKLGKAKSKVNETGKTRNVHRYPQRFDTYRSIENDNIVNKSSLTSSVIKGYLDF